MDLKKVIRMIDDCRVIIAKNDAQGLSPRDAIAVDILLQWAQESLKADVTED